MKINCIRRAAGRVTALILAFVLLVTGEPAIALHGAGGTVSAEAAMATPEYIAHRGDTYKAPENTIAALKEARKAGYDGVEFDIWFTRAGEILVSHDASLSRVYGEDIDVRDVPKGARKQYVAVDKGRGYPDSDLYLPSFKSFAQYIKKYGMKAYIHVKCPTATVSQMDHLKRAVDKYGISGQCVVFSSHSSVIKLIAERFKNPGAVFVRSAQLKYGYKGVVDRAVKYRLKTVIFSYGGWSDPWLKRGDVAYAKKKGLKVVVYQNKVSYDMTYMHRLGIYGEILAVEDLDDFPSAATASAIRIAHRGDINSAPENTLAAFKAAGESGWNGVELDIWFTKAGEVLVSHEKNLSKVYGDDVDITEVAKGTRSEYVAILPAGDEDEDAETEAISGAAIKESDLYLPSLASVLKAVSGYGMKLFVHVKNSSATATETDRLYRILEKYGAKDAIVFSGHEKVCKSLAADGRFHYTGGVYTGTAYRTYIKQAAADGLDVVIFCFKGNGSDVTRAAVNYAHGLGLDVFVYPKTNSLDISEAYKTGIDGEISNR